MNKLFTKISRLFLAGVVLVAVGCTDYDDDIQKIDKIIGTDNWTAPSLVEQIDALKKADQNLDAAIKEAEERAKLTFATKTELSDVQKALDEAVKAYKEADKQLQANIEKALADAQAYADSKDAALKTELEKSIKEANDNIAKHEERLNGLDETIKSLQTKIDDHQKAYEALKTTVEGQGEDIAEHAKTLEALQAALEAAKKDISENKEAIAANKKAIAENLHLIQVNATNIAENKGNIEKNAEAIKKNAEDIVKTNEAIDHLRADMDARFVELEAKLQAEIDALALRMSAAETAIADLKEHVIPAIQAQLDRVQELSESTKVSLDEYKAATNETIAVIQASLSDLTTALGLLDAKVEKYYSEIEKQLGLFVTKDDLKHALDELEAKLNAQIAANTDAIEALRGEIATNKEAISALKQDTAKNALAIALLENKVRVLENSLSKLESKVDALKTDVNHLWDYAEKNEQAINALKTKTEQAINSINVAIEDIVKTGGVIDHAIETALRQVKADIAKLQYDVMLLTSRMNTAEVNINKLLSRIQSIVYVPDYSDGKITVEAAKIGKTYVEGQSHATYKVLPAENAQVLAAAFAQDSTVLSYVHEDLKTRAAAHEFNIVDVKATAEGLLNVTFEARGLAEEFYAKELEYAIALVASHKDSENNVSTVYTNVTPHVTPWELVVVDSKKNVIDPETFGDFRKIEYTSTDTLHLFEAVTPAFKVGNEVLLPGEAADKGYAVPVITYGSQCEYLVLRADEGEVQTPFEKLDDAAQDKLYADVVGHKDGEGITDFWLKEANPDAVGLADLIEGIFKIDEYSEVVLKGGVLVTPIQVKVVLKDNEIKWKYELDAEVDAKLLANEEALYERNGLVAVVDSCVNWNDDLTLKDVFASPNYKVEIKKNGVALSAEDAAALLPLPYLFDEKVEGGANKFDFAGFEWKATYDITVTYNVGSAEVVVSHKVTTVPRPETLKFDLDTASVVVRPNLEFDGLDPKVNNQVTDLAVVYDKMAEFTDWEAEKYLKWSFTGNHYMGTVFTSGDEELYAHDPVKDSKQWITDLHIDYDPAEGASQMIWLGYSYRTNKSLVGQSEITYTKTVKTWFGQELVFVQTLKFIAPTYTFVHDPNHVIATPTSGSYYSLANAKYNPGKRSHAIDEFKVDALDLDVAFNVLTPEGELLVNKVKPYAESNIATEFELADPASILSKDGIKFAENTNLLAYEGVDESVKVNGKLYLFNDNGTKWEIPAAFDAYKDVYSVHKFDPIAQDSFVGEDLEIELVDAQVYPFNILKQFSLKEDRHDKSDEFYHDLIVNGKWAVGNDKNGFASSVASAADLYGLKFDFSATNVSGQISGIVSLDPNDGTLTFDNTSQLKLVQDNYLDITLKIGYTYGPQSGYNPADGLGYMTKTIRVTVKKNVFDSDIVTE